MARKPEPAERLLTISEAAERCGVSTKTIRRWIGARVLPAARLGRQWRIRPMDLRAFVAERLDW